MNRLPVVASLALAALVVGGCAAPTTTGSAGDKAKSIGTTKATPKAKAPATSAKPAAPNAAPAPKPAAPKVVSYKGHGDRVLTIKKPEPGAVVADFTHNGSANFIVTPYQGATQALGGNVNVIGHYKGRALLDADGSTETNKLKIQADGAWTVKISPVAVVAHFDKTYKGQGDNVIAYTGKGGTLAMTYRGQGNFIVSSTNDPMGLANQIGNYKGETIIAAGPSILSITAGTGTWTLKVT